MSRIAYYLVLKPLSLLPYPALYLLSDLLYLVLYRLIGFRTKVVRQNLRNSFPDRQPSELRRIESRFYLHFTDLLVEAVKLFSISREALTDRCRIENPEIFDRDIKEGRRIIATSGHYGNWEMAAQALSATVNIRLLGIYSPLKDKFMDRKMRESRGKFGMELVSSRQVEAAFLNQREGAEAFLFATDQAPSNPRKAWWTQFLNQETPVFFGAEKYAARYDCPVYYCHYEKVGRGRYVIRFELLADHAAQTEHGTVSRLHTRRLEQDILAVPEWWLWTHRRWKRQRPADIPLEA